MKKISSTFAKNHEFVARPFALVNHVHVEYFPIHSEVPIEIFTPIIFSGPVSGDGISAGPGDYNLEGGDARVVFMAVQFIDGGNASGIYTESQFINGGGA